MLPAAIGEDEVVEPVVEHLAGDSDAEAAGIGEVRQCHAPRLGALTEDHIPKAPGMGPRRAAPASPEPDVPQWARWGCAGRCRQRSARHAAAAGDAAASPPGLRARARGSAADPVPRPRSAGPRQSVRQWATAFDLALRWQARIDIDARLPSPWAVRSLKPARAAAVRWLWVWRSCM